MVAHPHHRPRIAIVSASVGAGHDGAAAEIARRLAERGLRVDRYDFLDLVPRPIGPAGRAAYRWMLRLTPGAWDWALARLSTGQRFGSTTVLLTALANRRLRTAIGTDVDAVISTYPLASQAIGRLRQTGRLDVPAATFLTDMSVHGLWIHPGIDRHYALHDVAAGQARGLDAADVRVVAPAVRPAFTARATPHQREELCERLGIPAGPPLALVVAGSWGVGEIPQAVRDIAETGLATPVVACGHNEALRARVAGAGHGIALGWIEDMAGLMGACDVVVQNAGGLSSLEALACGVPVITYRCLAGHGRTNADALDRAGWAPWVREPAGLAAALSSALAGGHEINPFSGTDVADAILALLSTAAASDAMAAA
jgi:UDP-N-acetylglucosamine:LPS N-acetylglucosamine transferase